MGPRLAVVLALLLQTASAHAGCPLLNGAEARLATVDDTARLTWIRSRLTRSAHRSTIWLRAWEIGILGATAVDLALIPILGNTRSNQIDFGLGAATTIVGIVPLLLKPPRVIADHRALEAASTTDDVCVRLVDAERRIVADASFEKHQRAWYVHAGNLVLNAGVTFLFGAFGHWKSGIANGIGGFVVGELIIFTLPDDQVDDLARYRRGELGDGSPSVQVVPLVGPDTAGLGIAFLF